MVTEFYLENVKKGKKIMELEKTLETWSELIIKLEKENARLREALENLRNDYYFTSGQVYVDIEQALKGGEE